MGCERIPWGKSRAAPQGHLGSWSPSRGHGQRRSPVPLHEAAQSNTSSELRASSHARLLQDPLPGRVLNTGAAGGTSGTVPPSRTWHRPGQSQQPPPAPAQLLPALPSPYPPSRSFPPLLQGTAEVGAAAATSLVPKPRCGPRAPLAGLRWKGTRLRRQCRQGSQRGWGLAPRPDTRSRPTAGAGHHAREPGSTRQAPAGPFTHRGHAPCPPGDCPPSYLPTSPSGCRHWDGNQPPLRWPALPWPAPSTQQQPSGHPAVPQAPGLSPAPTSKEPLAGSGLRRAAGRGSPAVGSAGWAALTPPQHTSRPPLPQPGCAVKLLARALPGIRPPGSGADEGHDFAVLGQSQQPKLCRWPAALGSAFNTHRMISRIISRRLEKYGGVLLSPRELALPKRLPCPSPEQQQQRGVAPSPLQRDRARWGDQVRF